MARKQLGAAPSAASDAATVGYVNALVVPVGGLIMWGSSTAPDHFLLCDGSELNRTTDAALYNAYGPGETYWPWGQGNGTTTFTLPSFTDKFPRGNTPDAGGGADTHTHTSAAHTHTSAAHTHTSAAHTHDLGDDGWADLNWSAGAGQMEIRRKTLGVSWAANSITTSNMSSLTASSATVSTGIALGGATASSTPAATGSTTPADTGSTTPADTGSGSNVPAHTGVSFIIRAS